MKPGRTTFPLASMISVSGGIGGKSEVRPTQWMRSSEMTTAPSGMIIKSRRAPAHFTRSRRAAIQISCAALRMIMISLGLWLIIQSRHGNIVILSTGHRFFVAGVGVAKNAGGGVAVED